METLKLSLGICNSRKLPEGQHYFNARLKVLQVIEEQIPFIYYGMLSGIVEPIGAGLTI